MNLNFAPSEIRRSRKRCARYIETHERLAGEVALDRALTEWERELEAAVSDPSFLATGGIAPNG